MKKFSPLVDKLFWIISIPTVIFIAAMTVISAFAPVSLIITIPVDLFVIYFLVSPLFGYVELRENSVYIRFGLIMKREIPYEKIRDAVKVRKLYSDSMVSLKNSIEHVNIGYNKFDIVSVSVVKNDDFIYQLKSKLSKH